MKNRLEAQPVASSTLAEHTVFRVGSREKKKKAGYRVKEKERGASIQAKSFSRERASERASMAGVCVLTQSRKGWKDRPSLR